MREGWKEYKLGDLVHIKHGYAFKGEYFTSEKTNNILLTPGNFKVGGGFKDDKLKYYNGPIPKDYVLKEDDIVVTMTDLSKMADTLGFSAKVPSCNNNIYLHNQRIGLVEKKNVDFDIDFLYWLLRFEGYQKFVAGSSTGATVKHTSPKKIYAFKFNAPANPETQRKIAKILSAYDDLIENNLKRIKLLEEMTQITYEEWFIRMKFPGHETTVFDKETGLPEGWKKVRIKDIGLVVTGKTPSTAKPEYFDGDIPFIKTPDMSNYPYVLNTNQYLSKKGANTQKNKFLPKNSVVVSCIGTAGEFALVSNLSQTNQQINAVVFKEEIYQFYFFGFAYFLKPLLEQLGSNGATMTNVNKGKFENIKISLPERNLLESYHNSVKDNFNMMLNLQSQNQLLKEARDILLPRLMTGMIDVENIIGQTDSMIEGELMMAAENGVEYGKEKNK